MPSPAVTVVVDLGDRSLAVDDVAWAAPGHLAAPPPRPRAAR
ncbi:hypothetical protein [Streptomyces sp. NPDC048282]